MTIEQLREVHQARPFREFTMQLANETKVDIPHPECLAVLRTGRTVIAATEGDGSEVIDLLLVTALDVADGQARRGKRRR